MGFFKWLKTSPATAIFSGISFVGGILFLNRNITGQVIVGDGTNLNALSVIGSFLVVCSIILAVYSLTKRNQ
ncbi:MAG: hypothetical protein AABX28_00805 [Nanoarchaeota archaeon]